MKVKLQAGWGDAKVLRVVLKKALNEFKDGICDVRKVRRGFIERRLQALLVGFVIVS